jgi:hypothetical protein
MKNTEKLHNLLDFCIENKLSFKSSYGERKEFSLVSIYTDKEHFYAFEQPEEELTQISDMNIEEFKELIIIQLAKEGIND